MSLSITRCTDPSIWNDFVSTSRQGSIFCNTVFLEAQRVKYDLWFVEKNGQPQVGAVVMLGDNEPTIYQGILFSGHSLNFRPHRRAKWTLEVIELLLKGLSERYGRLSFCLHHTIKDLRGLQWFNYNEPELGQFSIKLRYTGLIDLDTIPDFEDYFHTIRRNRQRDYRKAQSDGLIIEESNDIETLDQLHEMTFSRQDIQRGNREQLLLRSISEAAISKGFGKLLLCKNKQGETCSATLFLYDSYCGYSMFGATDPKFRSSGSYTYITLESIRRCKELRLKTWDFLGINSPYRGDFKTSFNSIPVPYYIITWNRPTNIL